VDLAQLELGSDVVTPSAWEHAFLDHLGSENWRRAAPDTVRSDVYCNDAMGSAKP
jgi:hypothetical protein